MDHSHFGYFKKLTKKHLGGGEVNPESFFITSGSGTDYHSTLAALTLINSTIFRNVEILKTCFLKEQKFVKENRYY